MADDRPIGIFDSGVGGLTVVRAVIERSPDEALLYLGDRARYPYGPRSIAEIRGFAVEIARELVAHDVKLLVVACNSVEVAAIQDVADAGGTPVVGVIDPGVRAAVARTRTGKIGLIGTEATVASGAYDRALARADGGTELLAVACPGVVEHIERGDTSSAELSDLLAAYLAPLRSAGVDALILGCTHYPLVADMIAAHMGPETVLVSSADATAADVASALDRFSLRATANGGGSREFLCTGDPAEFQALARRFLGEDVGVVRPVELAPVEA
ncbi:MAG: glutamate racemase [Actinomycetota bacterium]